MSHVASGRVGKARRDFAVDLAKAYTISLSGADAPWRKKIPYLLFNSELHCVAVFRFGQYADDLTDRHFVAGRFALFAYRLVNRWITHVDHTDIDRDAQIGPGMLLMHRHGILIGPAVIGANCAIHQNVTIGQRVATGNHGVPRIGDNVWIGPGAVVTGAITIGDGVTISALTVISRDVPDGCLLAGNPGRVVARNYDNSGLLNFVPPAAEE